MIDTDDICRIDGLTNVTSDFTYVEIFRVVFTTVAN
jgi:hypothetical protein